MLFRMIQSPKEGDEVQFLGVHAVKWRKVVDGEIEYPTVAFIEATDEEIREEYKRRFRCPDFKAREKKGGSHESKNNQH